MGFAERKTGNGDTKKRLFPLCGEYARCGTENFPGPDNIRKNAYGHRQNAQELIQSAPYVRKKYTEFTNFTFFDWIFCS